MGKKLLEDKQSYFLLVLQVLFPQVPLEEVLCTGLATARRLQSANGGMVKMPRGPGVSRGAHCKGHSDKEN